jgi:pyridoxal 5-phosphate dependent beta-lyase
MLSPQNGPGVIFRDARPEARMVHLDTAAAGRSSIATLRATAAYAQREAAEGAYVAQAEAKPVIEQGRASLARLLGVEPDGLAFTESGSAARAALLDAWQLWPGDTVAVVRSEWGPNLTAFANRGLQIVELAAHGDGTVDLDELGRFLAATPPAFVHLTQVASHRGLVQPVAEAAAVCHAAGVPLWVDVAQAVGHVDTASGADALYGTSRKWLTGPRGVGMVAVARSSWNRLRVRPSALDMVGVAPGYPPVQMLESSEANVAGRVGLANAVREYIEMSPETVHALLAGVGKATRAVLSEVPGWEIAGEADAPCAITSLRPLGGQDVGQVRERLLAQRLVTTHAHPARAPREMTASYLRVSPHIDCTDADLTLLADVLASL